MPDQDKKSIKLKLILLIALPAVFIPVSYAWYDTLSNFNCKEPTSAKSKDINLNPTLDKRNNCPQETNFHWIAFYGINGIIYGVPLLAVVVKARRNGRN